MLTAIITTDPVFGPWVIPSRAQNMINNFYARSQGYAVDTIIPEQLFTRALTTTRWRLLHQDGGERLGRLILCSIHQLPTDEREIGAFIDDLKGVELVFSLEGLEGRGEEFVRRVIGEARAFAASPAIPYDAVHSYDDLHRLMLAAYEEEPPVRADGEATRDRK